MFSSMKETVVATKAPNQSQYLDIPFWANMMVEHGGLVEEDSLHLEI